MKKQVNLGDKVKDSISGFSGICIAISHWLNGCDRITVQPDKLSKDGCAMAAESFDEPQVVVVRSGVIKPESAITPTGIRRTGGPRPEPNRGRSLG